MLQESYEGVTDSLDDFELSLLTESVRDFVVLEKRTGYDTSKAFEDFSSRVDQCEGKYPRKASSIRRELLTKRRMLRTGHRSLDEALSGGLSTCEVNEIVGPWGSGKTQFCLSACLENAIDGNTSLFIDSENNFSASGMLRFSNECPEKMEEYLTRVRSMHAESVHVLLNILYDLDDMLTNKSTRVSKREDFTFIQRLRLVVIDCMPTLLSYLQSTNNNGEGNSIMSNLGRLLKTIAIDHNICVLISNTRLSTGQPALGLNWAFTSDTRLSLLVPSENFSFPHSGPKKRIAESIQIVKVSTEAKDLSINYAS